MSESMKSKKKGMLEPDNSVCISTISHHARWDLLESLYIVQNKLEIGTKLQFKTLSQTETVLVPVSEVRYAANQRRDILRNITVRAYLRMPTEWQKLILSGYPVGTLCLEICYKLSEERHLDVMDILHLMSSGIIRDAATMQISPFRGL